MSKLHGKFKLQIDPTVVKKMVENQIQKKLAISTEIFKKSTMGNKVKLDL